MMSFLSPAGGAKGITAACALGVARATGARMVLVGRSPDPHGLSDQASPSEITEILQKYSAAGLFAKYYSCDVCDLEAVAAMIDRIRQEIGPVSGVIHGAGLNHPRPASQVSVPEAIHEVRPKIMGALNLMYVLENDPPKLFVGFSSIIGVTGMAGNAWYGFSNESLDVILRQFETNHSETKTLAVAFSIWRDEGMGARLGSVERLKLMGVDAIPTEEGVRRFVHLFLNDPGVQHVIVSARLSGLDTWDLDPYPLELNARYLEEPLGVTPGVESIFRTHLNLEKDPYLKDHNFNGSYLFPTVFGLEAMAQVAAHVTGISDFSRVRIEDINLKRPIVVDPTEGAEIVVWAQVQEWKSDSDKLVVRSGITKAQTGGMADFFSATFVLGLTNDAPSYKIDIPDEPLNIQPLMDLYRPTLLFQGTRFQRIKYVWELAAKGEIAERVVFSSKAEGLWKVSEMAFPEAPNSVCILGDPFFRDSLLQSAQLLVPQKTCLPVHIRRLEIYPSDMKKPLTMFATAQLNHMNEQEIEDTVVAVNDKGCILQKLEGYSLKVLHHHTDYPTATDLICPDHRDNQIVSDKLQYYGQTSNLHVPKVLLKHLPGLHNLDSEERHKRELPLLKETVVLATDQYPDEEKSFNVQWLKSGKPVVKGDGINNVEISVSHDEGLCICVAGPEVQGCDIEPIAQRSRAEWSGLLGPQREKILDLMLKETDSLDLAGTMIWSAVEALRKATGKSGENLHIIENKDDFALFKSTSSELPIHILTLPLDLTLGPRRILALVVREVSQHSSQVSQDDSNSYKGCEDLFETRQFDTIAGGPQGQGMFVRRFPVTFKANSQLSRTVYLSNYLFWLGEVREASVWPVLRKVTQQFSTGNWGLVTNNLHMRVLGEATAKDQIEIRLWVTGNGGAKNATMDLTFDFRKILANRRYERLAWCEQQVTWVRILEHGQVKPEAYPEYYWELMKDMLPRYDAANVPEPLPETLRPLLEAEADICRYQALSGPVVRSVLHEQIIDTTLDNSNLVGNIYFANYYSWMGQTRDRYFFNLIPDYFRGTGEKGELLCLECRVDHLREAMPFDRIVVTMALKVLNTFSATFYFEYFRQEPDGTRLKLAVGEHLAVWVKRDEQGRPIPAPFPQPVLNNIQQAIIANKTNHHCIQPAAAPKEVDKIKEPGFPC